MSPARQQSVMPLVASAPADERSVPFPFQWRMRDEFAFLRGLGTWRQRASVVDRAQLFRGYLQGLALRKRWIGLECEALECEARFLLEKVKTEPMAKSA